MPPSPEPALQVDLQPEAWLLLITATDKIELWASRDPFTSRQMAESVWGNAAGSKKI